MIKRRLNVTESFVPSMEQYNQFLRSENHIQLAIATYHNQNDYMRFENHLSQRGYSVNHTKGHILFFYDKTIQEPYLRRCILQATNKG